MRERAVESGYSYDPETGLFVPIKDSEVNK